MNLFNLSGIIVNIQRLCQNDAASLMRWLHTIRPSARETHNSNGNAWQWIKSTRFPEIQAVLPCSSMFIILINSRIRHEQIFTEMHKPHMVFFVSQRRSQIWPWFYPEINVYKDPLKKSFDAQSLNHNIYTITQWKCMIQTPNYSTFQALLNPYNNCKN